MKKFTGSSDYVASKELMNAVNVAMALEKPLLIKGEPGTGKTMLAQSIADALSIFTIRYSVSTTRSSEKAMSRISAPTSAWENWERRSHPRSRSFS